MCSHSVVDTLISLVLSNCRMGRAIPYAGPVTRVGRSFKNYHPMVLVVPKHGRRLTYVLRLLVRLLLQWPDI